MRPRLRPHIGSWVLVLLALVTCCSGIIPDQLVSFMQVFFSNFPSVRRGTDSRVGVGFRFGPLADAQVVWELGPQVNTASLRPPPIREPDKRHVPVVRGGGGGGGALGHHFGEDPFLADSGGPSSLQGPHPHGGGSSLSDGDNSIQSRARALRPVHPVDVRAAGDWLERWRDGFRSPRDSQNSIPAAGGRGWQKVPDDPPTASSISRPRITLASTTSTAGPPPAVGLIASLPVPTAAVGPVLAPAPGEGDGDHLRATVSRTPKPRANSKRPRDAEVRKGRTTASPRYPHQPPETRPATFLRMAMESLRTTTAAPPRTPPQPSSPAFRPAGFFRVLRQLWEAGAKVTTW